VGEVAGVKAVYRGERRISMRQMSAGAETAGRTERARKRHSSERLGMEAADAPLFEAMRAWRREPPYVIFHDTTLSAIARERPASPDDLAKISGVGQSKLKRYGADVLKVGTEAPRRCPVYCARRVSAHSHRDVTRTGPKSRQNCGALGSRDSAIIASQTPGALPLYPQHGPAFEDRGDWRLVPRTAV